MRSLADLQRAFSGYLMSPEARPDPALQAEVDPRGGLPIERLAIYRNNVHVRLVEALESAYPAVRRLVGDDYFSQAAREYIAAHPPRAPTLLDFGHEFPAFLRVSESASSVPYLPDVARLEQLYLEAYHAPEASSITAADVVACLQRAHEDRTLTLHPSARLMRSPFPVSRIWEVNRAEEPIKRMKIPAGRDYLLIVRPQAVVEVRRVSEATHAALGVLAEGGSVSVALALGRGIDPAEDLAANLISLAHGATFSLPETATQASHSNA